jgi:hypothetical protein
MGALGAMYQLDGTLHDALEPDRFSVLSSIFINAEADYTPVDDRIGT